jgi:hypothetical protein
MAMTFRNYNYEHTLNIPDREPESIIHCSGFVKSLPNKERPYGYVTGKKFVRDAMLGMDVIMAYIRISDIVQGAQIRIAARYDQKCKRYRVIRIDSVVPT